jgi:hypothetical protein
MAVLENCNKELEKSSKRMKKYAEQSRIQPPSFEPRNLVMPNRKNIKTRHPAPKLNHKCYGRFEILNIIAPTAVRLCFPKTWKIYPGFHVSLIKPFVESNRDVDLITVLKISDPFENAPEYDVDKVMGSTDKDWQVL